MSSIDRAADALTSSSKSAQKAALSSQSSFVKFLKKLGLHGLASMIIEWIRDNGWPALKKFIKITLGIDD